MTYSRIVLGGLLALLSSSAFAHYPTLDCQPLNQTHVVCVAGYSDGSVATDETVSVFSYDDDLISDLSTDSDGKVQFERPEGEYYMVFDPGHEDPAEFDYAEF